MINTRPALLLLWLLLCSCSWGEPLYIAQDPLDGGDFFDAESIAACVCPAPDASAERCPTPPPYMPPPWLDAAQPDAQRDGGGVPCVRWREDGGSCWFQSGADEQFVDLLCEDNEITGDWCRCYGFDFNLTIDIPACGPQ